MDITPSYLASFETNMRVLQARTFSNLLGNIWYPQVFKVTESDALKEIVFFALEAAQLHDGGEQGGFKDFDVLTWLNTNYTNRYKQSGFELTEAEMTDSDGRGIQKASQWLTEITTVQAYQPQIDVAAKIITPGTAYDGQNFFVTTNNTSTGHPVSGVAGDVSKGVYGNLLTGSASAPYPGACPLQIAAGTTTLDAAANNLGRALAYVRGAYKTPTGYPRNLRVRALLVPPSLAMRAQQVTNARVLPAAAASGGGPQDMEPLIGSDMFRNWGLGTPIVAPELGSAITGVAADDFTYYIVMEPVGDIVAGFYFNRQAYGVTYHDKMTDAELDRADKMQWFTKGRNSCGMLHPFMLIKCTPT